MVGADPERLALAGRADAAFIAVETSAAPSLRETSACIQAQAALLPVATPFELPQIRYRKGYCALAGAVVTNSTMGFLDAALAFENAVQAWSARPVAKKWPAEPVPSALLVLAAVARLEAGAAGPAAERARAEILRAVDVPACSSSLMREDFCRAMLRTGRIWLGWLALRADNLAEATRHLSSAPGSNWAEWAAGRESFAWRRYGEAASHYRRALDLQHSERVPTLAERLEPPPDEPSQLAALGDALLLAGDFSDAIAVLNATLKADPSNARALYLRALAKEGAGLAEAALADYSLASRAAFAAAQDLASAEAHLYRGILLFRRKNYSQAENEFASALNFAGPAGVRADAVAWRHLAAVAGGSCEASRELLERSLESVSPHFPRQEARLAAASCGTAPATVAAGPAAR